ncbi:STAS domain-containing protein [Priestia megaterium]|uniref:STAS domain-containing protein n=1 Tax=Priestia megaterium TaxID=1404 RepID=UPI00048E21E8|nr:STAS domain-containing protein [Priestia megaterium]PFD97796.1 STAS domain-containing protein [Priestia megaterium]PFJ96168.1 STAS domain-containing protein [Priestia megaterium]PGY50603.1 STAS domain-containing protein [Priestia megaterium]PMD10702.1 STAS domain-containing protein [Priestia megaterium]
MQYIQQEKLHAIKETILQRKEKLAENKRLDLATSHNIYTELTTFRLDLLTTYANSLFMEKEAADEVMEQWGNNMANLLVDHGLPLNLALDEISHYRDVIGEIIKAEAKNNDFSLDAFYQIISHFNSIVDNAIQFLSKSYVKDYTEKINYAQYAIDELSVPVVRMTEEIGILPLVGDLDTKRAQYLMESALEKGSHYKLKWLIIDLSAVPIIDTMVADQLFKVIAGLQLLGIEVVISGIRPEIAQTMVSLGIKVEEVRSFSSLHQAVQYTNSFTGSLI